jgi:hypothetical protein
VARVALVVGRWHDPVLRSPPARRSPRVHRPGSRSSRRTGATAGRRQGLSTAARDDDAPWRGTCTRAGSCSRDLEVDHDPGRRGRGRRITAGSDVDAFVILR